MINSVAGAADLIMQRDPDEDLPGWYRYLIPPGGCDPVERRRMAEAEAVKIRARRASMPPAPPGIPLSEWAEAAQNVLNGSRPSNL